MTIEITRDFYQIANNIEKSYTYRSIKKRNGGERLLAIPDKRLARIQRQLLDEIITGFPVHSAATAFLPGSSILCNAKYHLQYPMVLTLDLRDFFDSVPFSSVFGLFCRHTDFPREICVLFARLCCLSGSLPQGAPTSPALANAAFYPIDQRISGCCDQKDINYTRYADDLTFSGHFEAGNFIHFITRLLGEYAINEKKTRLYRAGMRQTVTGILVNEKLQVTKEYRRNIRQEMHYIQKFGVHEHLTRKLSERPSPEEKSRYLQSLLGRVSHVLFVNPEDQEFLRYKQVLLCPAPKYYAYMLECADGSLYTGFTTDIQSRINTHNRGKGAKYTRSRLPVTLVYAETFESKPEAMRREAAIKRLSRAQKWKLIESFTPAP